MRSKLLALAGVAVIGAVVAGCGTTDSTAGGEGGAPVGGAGGTITVDGSSTVGPYVTIASEDFTTAGAKTQVTVGISGTGGGFERFCKGETDISNASRSIKDEEKAVCTSGGVDYAELQIANDGIAVVANNDNDWATCLTTAQLKKIWEPKSTVTTWKDVDPTFPDEQIKLFGPGTDSGTFDFFTKAINGEEDASRTDYQPSENDNVTVEGVAGEKGGLGYFGLSYFEQNKSKLKDVAVDGGKGCITPSSTTVQDASYAPLSRPLFVYVKKSSYARQEVKDFVKYMIDNEAKIAEEALFVPLTPAQLDAAKSALAAIG
jgi:phosphate transport system substrate-binding protein